MASTSRRVDPFSVGDILYGSSGRRYTVDEILSDRRKPLRCVYRAWYVGAPDMVTQTQTFRGLKANKSYVESAQGERYIVKNILQGDFEYQQELQKPLSAFLTSAPLSTPFATESSLCIDTWRATFSTSHRDPCQTL